MRSALLTRVRPDGSFVEMNATRWRITRDKRLEFEGSGVDTGIPAKFSVSAKSINSITQDNQHDITIEVATGESIFLTWIVDANSMSCKALIREISNIIGKREVGTYGTWTIHGFRQVADPSVAQVGTLSMATQRSAISSKSVTTAGAISSGLVDVRPGKVPIFLPSLAEVPRSMQMMNTPEEDLQYAIQNSPSSFQSFFNDLHPLTPEGFNDDVISENCFDEGLYCSLVREMHRYTLAEVGANQDQIAKSNAGLGAMVGSFLGLITGNIFAPFLGHTYGRNMVDRSRRIEEFLPDPAVLFGQDPNSYLSWSRAQVSSPRLRRLILDRQVDGDQKVYFRLLPAIVTADSVLPIQLFKLAPSTYFYRPLAAGIGDEAGRKQPHYDPIKIQRRYFHLRAEGDVVKTDLSFRVRGRDIEDYNVMIYRYVGHSLDYFYADFKILPGSVF